MPSSSSPKNIASSANAMATRRETVVVAQRPSDEPLDDRMLVALLVSTAFGSVAAMISAAYGVHLLLS